MQKKNVFLVSGRFRDEGGTLAGEVSEMVICSSSDDHVRQYLRPYQLFEVVSITSLIDLEARTNKILNVLKGADKSWKVIVDPRLVSENTNSD